METGVNSDSDSVQESSTLIRQQETRPSAGICACRCCFFFCGAVGIAAVGFSLLNSNLSREESLLYTAIGLVLAIAGFAVSFRSKTTTNTLQCLQFLFESICCWCIPPRSAPAANQVPAVNQV